MQWPYMPYPPGYEPPGLGFVLLGCILTLCFVGITLYLVFTGRIKIEVEKEPKFLSRGLESGGAAEEGESKKNESDETS
jgi:hypothetical protein